MNKILKDLQYKKIHTLFQTWISHDFNPENFTHEIFTHEYFNMQIRLKQKRSTEGCSKFKSPEPRQVQERLVSTLEHMQVPKWDRTRCTEE